MKNKKSIWIGGLLAALVLAVVIGATSVYAQGPTPTEPPRDERGPGGRGPLGGPGMEAAAQALGMTADELTSALKEGKTLEQLAEEKGVDIAEVQAALQAERETEMRERIQQALDNGTITQEHADWLLEGLDKGFLGKPGGFGMGFDGPHGPGRGPAPADGTQPTRDAGQ